MFLKLEYPQCRQNRIKYRREEGPSRLGARALFVKLPTRASINDCSENEMKIYSNLYYRLDVKRQASGASE